jgi:hypothetical protein
MENYRLSQENLSLKNEKAFLIDQIKFMQNLIRSNDIKLKVNSCRDESHDLERNMPTPTSNSQSANLSAINLNGAKQRPFSKIFSVFIICVLSITYVSFDNNMDFGSGDKIVFSTGSTISLNDSSERQKPVNNLSNKMFGFMPDYIVKGAFIVLLAYLYWNIELFWAYLKKFFLVKNEKFNKKL